jgi:exopolyphosphatase/pppGpp-phosphohydrolase
VAQRIDRVAIIDLGTNSVRIDIYDVYPDGQTERVRQEKSMVRLGDSVFSSTEISPEAIDRSLNELERYAAAARELTTGLPCAVRSRSVLAYTCK